MSMRGRRKKVPAFRRKPKPVAVLDTNIILDTHSCHDLTSTLDQLYPTLGDAVLEDQRVTFRIERARESTLLAIHLHLTGATTFGLHSEMLDVLERRAPPSAIGLTFESTFTMVFIWFVKGHVLSGWNHTVPKKPDLHASKDADRAVVTAAKERNVPLISNEGYSQTGAIDQTKLIRSFAQQEGVLVQLPREFYAGKLSEQPAIDIFLRKFARLAPDFIKQRRKRFGDDGTVRMIQTVFGLYRLILKGEAEGRDAVRLALRESTTPGGSR